MLSTDWSCKLVAVAQPITYFVCGHLDVTEEEFAKHYEPRLNAAVAEGASFVVGDARGCDTMVQAFLRGVQVGRDRVRVFHMLTAPRFNVGDFPVVGGFASDSARDAAMTEASTADIAWVRPGREKSGTARNLARRSPVT